ncbi:MAG: YdcH family protein [Pseudomonadota bacterium]
MNIMDREEILRSELDVLREEHRSLDGEIAEAEGAPLPDRLAITRMKKRKLMLKDRIARIEDQLYPDIIA